ncbi:NAD(P)/FAD-dependent oxidoreductase [Luteipulveratus flavus]|uniref:NAD(P)/FAD-dependent oxidoreductase n=1 Tax=Luteipulveratus flavus TaxID=3031728 RepID=A0ABT6C4J2_9MICO|nr:NAD(P)/FAD-dependent oxidoreductase [Luteipulveratus sp. YIM 133296]MDF8263458.1 NAD(P)/FAD-dependent oxidoreductase [Luteipulveratus sp. YIM 133296]
MNDTQQQYDVLVIGGGPAGLSAALVLGRSRRSVLVVDAGEPRNAPAAHMQAFLSRDGAPPSDLLAAGRAEVAAYGVDIVGDSIAEIDRTATGFTATTTSGATYDAGRVVLATGLRDVLPDVPGIRERWGRDVIHCPYCHGWEVRDQRIAVLATGPMSAHQAQLFRQLSDRVTFLAGDTDPDAETRTALEARGIEIVTGPVAELVVEDDRLTGVRTGSGAVLPLDVLVVGTRMEAPRDLPDRLGLEMTELPGMGRQVTVDDMGATTVPGVWAAGNAADVRMQVINAAAAGNLAGAAVNMDMVQEEVRLAVQQQASRTTA